MAVRTINFYGAYSTFRPFILTVDSGVDARYTIPTSGGGYNYSVNTSDGQTFNGVTGNQLIIFPLANTLYDIEIRGLFPRIYVNNNAERLKVRDVKQWGDVVWGSMLDAFYGCSNLGAISATDAPDLTMVTIMARMFYNCTAFNSDVSSWNVGNVTNMDNMFYNCTAFNSDVSSWNVENVTSMANMFYNCLAFNSDVSSWNVGSVTNMTNMFYNCTAFNSDVSSWNVENVTSMANMFQYCLAFNSDVSNWNVGNVTNMANMFGGASLFNSDLSNWNVSKVTSLFAFLRLANSYSFDIDFSNAVTGSVLNTNIASFYRGGSSISIKMQCGNVVTTDLFEFDGALITEMGAIEMSKSFRISLTALTGIGIDDLANSVKDMTGLTSPSITMTLAQRASCNQALWTNKNWTIIAV